MFNFEKVIEVIIKRFELDVHIEFSQYFPTTFSLDIGKTEIIHTDTEVFLPFNRLCNGSHETLEGALVIALYRATHNCSNADLRCFAADMCQLSICDAAVTKKSYGEDEYGFFHTIPPHLDEPPSHWLNAGDMD